MNVCADIEYIQLVMYTQERNICWDDNKLENIKTHKMRLEEEKKGVEGKLWFSLTNKFMK